MRDEEFGSAGGAGRVERAESRNDVEVVDAHALLGQRGLVRIELDGEVYTLRLTRNRRLILTK